MKKQIVIIGGGASGLTAGICAARAGASAVILERMDRAGKKILSTGNGRCNMTNLVMRADRYRCGQRQFPMRVLDQFSVWDTLAFFQGIGIETKNRNGYIYPNSDQASAVLDALLLEAAHRGAELVTGCQAEQIKRLGRDRFLIRTSLGSFEANRVILAAGSRAAPATGSNGSGYRLARELGHQIIKPLPALVQLRCKGDCFQQLAGIRCQAAVKLLAGGRILAAEEGELQLTDYGISGIPTFQVSRFASAALDQGQQVTAWIDFFPGKSMEETRKFICSRIKSLGYRRAEDFLTGAINKKLALALLKQAGIRPGLSVSQISREQAERLAGLLKRFEAVVTASNSFEQAQVCCGGVDTAQVRPESLESRLVPGLYLTGELLDVDGVCGGYNLQWAWSTGAIAGRRAAESVLGLSRPEERRERL